MVKTKSFTCGAGRTGEGVDELVYVAMFPLRGHIYSSSFLSGGYQRENAVTIESHKNGELDYRQGLYGQFTALSVSVASLFEHPLIFDSEQISEWILLLAAFALVGLRIYTRLFVQRQKLRLSEYVLLFSALIGLGLIICE